jgi:hypothetical protein
MTKAWQDFFATVFMAIGYVYTIIFCIQLLKREDTPEDKRLIAYGVLLLWLFGIPGMLFYLGGGSFASNLSFVLMRPFVG